MKRLIVGARVLTIKPTEVNILPTIVHTRHPCKFTTAPAIGPITVQ